MRKNFFFYFHHYSEHRYAELQNEAWSSKVNMEMTLHITIYQYLMGFVERWNNNIFHIQLWSLQLRSLPVTVCRYWC